MRESGCPAISKVLQELWGVATRRKWNLGNGRRFKVIIIALKKFFKKFVFSHYYQ